MTKTGKLNKREMETLRKAWIILSDWTQLKEDECADDEESYGQLYDDYKYTSAMNAVCGLCEFIGGYGMED